MAIYLLPRCCKSNSCHTHVTWQGPKCFPFCVCLIDHSRRRSKGGRSCSALPSNGKRKLQPTWCVVFTPLRLFHAFFCGLSSFFSILPLTRVFPMCHFRCFLVQSDFCTLLDCPCTRNGAVAHLRNPVHAGFELSLQRGSLACSGFCSSMFRILKLLFRQRVLV